MSESFEKLIAEFTIEQSSNSFERPQVMVSIVGMFAAWSAAFVIGIVYGAATGARWSSYSYFLWQRFLRKVRKKKVDLSVPSKSIPG